MINYPNFLADVRHLDHRDGQDREEREDQGEFAGAGVVLPVAACDEPLRHSSHRSMGLFVGHGEEWKPFERLAFLAQMG